MGNKVIDLTGQTFNRWTVDHFVGMNPAGGSLWECICKCGTRRPLTGNTLTHKTHPSKSCGCLKKETDRQNGIVVSRLSRSLRRRKLRPYECLYNHAARSAKARGLSCGLTYKTFCGLVAQTQCHYCYGELRDRPPYGPCVLQLDRKDNAQGYGEDNVVSCCTGCNRAKGGQSYEYAITQRELWRQQRGDRISDAPLEKPKRVYTNAARFERRSCDWDRRLNARNT